ncbi:MAG TPA: lysophospholipase [Anaerolineales bacterium]|nr:lysophospholipase [Anaerolineales bacterium]
MKHTELGWKALDGLNIFAQTWEPDSPPKAVICLVHGLGEHSGRYAHVAETLNRGGYAVIASDLRGHGKTEGKRGHSPSFNAFMDDIAILMGEYAQRYAGLPCFLWGHSLGGVLVVNYVLRRKPKLTGVVITSPGLKTSISDQKMKIQFAKIAGKFMPEMSMPTGLDAKLISRDPAVVERYVNDPLVHGTATLAMAKYTIEAIPWAYAHASEWDLPVLIMHGDADAIAFVSGSEEFASKIAQDCTLKIWPGLWHETHNEPEKEQVLAYALGWLDGQLS